MERLARLRNLIVHRYWEVDDSRILGRLEAMDSRSLGSSSGR